MDSSTQQRSLMPADFQIGLTHQNKILSHQKPKGEHICYPNQSRKAPKSNSKDGERLKHFVTRILKDPEKKMGEIKCLIVENANEIPKLICRALFKRFYCSKATWDALRKLTSEKFKDSIAFTKYRAMGLFYRSSRY